MTNEDIIKGLTLMRKNFDSNSVYGSYCIDCLDAAIEALKEQPEHSQNTPQKQPDLNTLGIKTEETCEDVISRRDAIDVLESAQYSVDFCKEHGIDRSINMEMVRIRLNSLPSVQSKQLQILASVLDGCPLTQPCNKMWKPEGWCKEHCKPGQQEPNAECWLKYAEVMANDQ